MFRTALIAVVALPAVVGCASTARDAEIAELRARVERAENSAAEAKAMAQQAMAAAEKAKPAPTPADPAAALRLYEQGRVFEAEGKGAEAVRVYARAARTGSGKAALRLGEIYDKGIPGVQGRNYAESLMWYNAARVLGEDVPLAKKP